jgi:hypothetical protein
MYHTAGTVGDAIKSWTGRVEVYAITVGGKQCWIASSDTYSRWPWQSWTVDHRRAKLATNTPRLCALSRTKK